jgi:hypothetical protein
VLASVALGQPYRQSYSCMARSTALEEHLVDGDHFRMVFSAAPVI